MNVHLACVDSVYRGWQPLARTRLPQEERSGVISTVQLSYRSELAGFGGLEGRDVNYQIERLVRLLDRIRKLELVYESLPTGCKQAEASRERSFTVTENKEKRQRDENSSPTQPPARSALHQEQHRSR